MKIIQITDIHMPALKEDCLYGVFPYKNLQKVVKNLQSVQSIDCIIITGDVTHEGDYDAYLHAWELFQTVKAPIYWIQGNHDYLEVMLQVANKVNIKSDKSFVINDTKFILLHSVVKDEDDLSKNKARGFLFDYEMEFLKRELNENNYQQCVIALHHPPVLSNSWADKRILGNKDEFISTLEKYQKVKLVLYGHQHMAQHTIINEVNYISAPPVAYHFNPNGEKFSLIDNKSGYAMIEIADNKDITYNFQYLL
jgi:Icc protein